MLNEHFPKKFITSNPLLSKEFDRLLILIIGLGLFGYTAFTINYFHYDDKISIITNPSIRNIFDIPEIWSAFNTRVVLGISLAINYWLNGMNVYGYRLFNILLHIANACLVYQLAALTFFFNSQYVEKNRRIARMISLFSALIFLTHSIQTETINFLTQRAVLLASFFYLAALISYIRARLTSKIYYYLSALGLTLLAMFSKEFTITLPIMLFLYEFLFLSSLEESFVNRIKKLMPFLLMLGIIPLMLLNTSLKVTPTSRIAALTLNSDVIKPAVDITHAGGALLSRKEYFLTELNVLRTYLRLLFCPINQNVDYDYPISKEWKEPKTIFSFVLLLTVFLLGIFLFNRQRIVSFCIFWFFLTLSVESSVIPIHHVIAEYRLYLAVVGFSMAIPISIFYFLRSFKKGLTFLVLIVFIFSIVTSLRNAVWGNEVLLWEDTFTKSSNKTRVLSNLVSALIDQSEYDRAVPYLKRAIMIDPLCTSAYLNLGLLYLRKGKFPLAKEYYLKGISTNLFDPSGYRELGFVYANLKDFDNEILCYEKALRLDPRDVVSRTSLVLAYLTKNDKFNAAKQILTLRTLGETQLANQLEGYLNHAR